MQGASDGDEEKGERKSDITLAFFVFRRSLAPQRCIIKQA